MPLQYADIRHSRMARAKRLFDELRVLPND